MENIDFLLERFAAHPERTAIIWRERVFSYAWLSEQIQRYQTEIDKTGILPGTVVSLKGDFTPHSIALFLALTQKSCIIAPVLRSSTHLHQKTVSELAQIEWAYEVSDDDRTQSFKTDAKANYALYETVRERQHPGLVLFSSGTSGTPKAAVHDFYFLLEKFKTARDSMSIINFLLFDHWGGLNTLLHTLSSCGTVFTVDQRSPDFICQAIETFKIEVLPASPTFLNLLLISNAHRKYDLSSLKVISYGTEPMPLSTLTRIQEAIPHVKLHQTYGLIELGVLRSKSKSNDSLWVKIGGEGYETRVVDGMLQIKARSAMLGYLNAPSPFTDDGWYKTGDEVQVDGEYFRILGRKSELINVGGEKVYPQEVESIILQAPNIADATVYGEKNPLIGNIVCAKISVLEPENSKDLSQRIKKFCRERMPSFKVPVKIEIQEGIQHTERFKKKRSQIAEA